MQPPRVPATQRRRAAARGFTLIELLVSITLLSLLLGLAMPSFGVWTRNAQVRSVADGLQAGIRLAQTEALRRNRQVVFFLTNNKACTSSIAATVDGPFWSIRTIPMIAGETAEVVTCGQLADTSAGVAIDGLGAAVCFNSLGRQVANAATGVTNGNCTLGTTDANFDVTLTGADRRLRVSVSLGGRTRLCDIDRTLSTANPDGCA